MIALRTVMVTTFRNAYHCEACDESWSDTWCCACDDKCPVCNAEIEPEESEELEQNILDEGEICMVCGSAHLW